MSVCVIGSINLDLVASVERLPAPGETVTARGLARFSGGKGANQAQASARWGAPTALIGAVGDDEAGRDLLTILRAAGIDVSAVATTAAAPTGQAFISVSSEGENAIVVIGGANMTLTPEHGAAAPLPSRSVLLAQMETPSEAAAALFARSDVIGPRVLNAAPALAAARDLFPLCDILIVNETELAHFAGPSAETGEAARRLLERPEQSVIVTLGAEGALAVTSVGEMRVAGHPVEAVDTTGAGDCFCGVLAAALDQGEGLPRALALANAAAALSTEFAGAAPPADLRRRVARLAIEDAQAASAPHTSRAFS